MATICRAAWTRLSDSQLLEQCAVDTYRASGPGGQKRNKTSSAVRIRHLPSGLIVIAEESRSQHENRQRALRRLRQALYLKVRNELDRDDLAATGWQSNVDAEAVCDGKLPGTRKDPRFWPLVGVILDVLQALRARVAEAAAVMNVSTAQLVEFLALDSQVWQQTNQLRARFDQKPLRT